MLYPPILESAYGGGLFICQLIVTQSSIVEVFVESVNTISFKRAYIIVHRLVVRISILINRQLYCQGIVKDNCLRGLQSELAQMCPR